MEEQERVVKEQNPNEVEQEQKKVATKQQKIYSWGAGTEGQLGTTKLQDEHKPQLLIKFFSSFGQISHLSCGGAHVIALTSGGKVLSWGRGSSGQLGYGEIVPNCLYPRVVDSLSSLKICHVSAGWNHSGFVSDSGCLFTCGDGSFGQLGHGDYQSCSLPTEVSFFNSKHVEQVACGMRHTLALLKGNFSDKLYGFGSGKRGQLGISEDKIKSVNVPQACSGTEGGQVVAILANGDQSAALSDNGGLYTWGRGFSRGSNVCIPQAVSSASYITQAALGWNHALVLTSEGEVFLLGGSNHGLLSEPPKTAQLYDSSGKPTLSKVTGLEEKKVVQIAAGAEHSAIVRGRVFFLSHKTRDLYTSHLNWKLTCATTEKGEICTWGWGEHGQLGLGSSSDHTGPQLVLPEDNSQNSKVYCGSGFTFALRTP